MKKTQLMGILASLLMASMIIVTVSGAATPTLSLPSGSTYDEGEVITVRVTNHDSSAYHFLSIQFTDPGGDARWVDQISVPSAETYDYTLLIPSDWEEGTWTVYVRQDGETSASTTYTVEYPVVDDDDDDDGGRRGGGTSTSPDDTPLETIDDVLDQVESIDQILGDTFDPTDITQVVDDLASLDADNVANLLEVVLDTVSDSLLAVTDVFEAMDNTDMINVLEEFDPIKSSLLLETFDPTFSANILTDLTTETAINIVNNLDDTGLQNILSLVPAETTGKILQAMDTEKLTNLLKVTDATVSANAFEFTSPIFTFNSLRQTTSDLASFTDPTGGIVDPSYSYTVNYPDGTSQNLLPFVTEDNFFDNLVGLDRSFVNNLQTSTATNIIGAMNTETAGKALDNIRSIGDSLVMAKALGNIPSNEAGEILSKMENSDAASKLTAALHVYNPIKAAETVEDQVKTLQTSFSSSFEGLDVSRNRLDISTSRSTGIILQSTVDFRPDYFVTALSTFQETVNKLPTSTKTIIFQNIAGLPNTPSTVAVVFYMVGLEDTSEIVSYWIETADISLLGDVFGYMKNPLMSAVYLDLTTSERETLYPYLDDGTAFMLPKVGEFDVSGLSVTPAAVDIGDPVSISVLVENPGTEPGATLVSATVKGETVGTTLVNIAAGGSETVTWTVSETEPGLYSVRVSGLKGTFRVNQPLGPADIRYNTLTKSSYLVEIDGTMTVTVTVENRGESSGTEKVELVIDGSVVESESVTLGAGESTTVTFTLPSADAGTHEIEVGGLTRSYSVAPLPPGTPWAVIIGVIAMIGAIVYLYSRE